MAAVEVLGALALALAVGAWVRLEALSQSVRRAAEARPSAEAEARAARSREEPESDPVLRRRIDDLEARCLALESRPPEPRLPPPPLEEAAASPVEALRRHLHDRGFEDVRVQGEGNPRSPLRIEAVRAGTVYKGRVDAQAPGALEERLRPARRAFP
jgi:hypothetical protein